MKQDYNLLTLFQLQKNNYLTKIVNAYVAFDLGYWRYNPVYTLSLQNCLFVDTNVVKVLIKVNICIVALEQHLTGLVNGALVIILLDILLFLVLLIVHQFILKTKKIIFYYQMKDQLILQMIALTQQRKSLILTLLNQRYN